MGMDITIYTKELSADLIPKIKERFSDFQMDIEFHPRFKFDEQAKGFLPVKLKIRKGHSKQYDNIDFEIISGFEFFFSSYDFDEQLEELRNIQQEDSKTETKSFLSRIFGVGKTTAQVPINFVANEELDKLLKNCKKTVTIHLKSWNKSELRVSLFFAAFLAELTSGVIYDPQNGRDLSAEQALQVFPLEINEYEESFTTQEFTVGKFEGWL